MIATIEPNSFATLALRDTVLRKKQYMDAISFYLKKTSLNIIVFVENSGNSLKNEFQNYVDRLEWLTFKSIPFVPDKGKGSEKLEIINYSMNNSEFIANADEVIKVSGRLKVLNIIELYSCYLKQKNKHRKVFSSNIYKNAKMDVICFLFMKDFSQYFQHLGQSIDLNYSIESAMWDSVFL